MKKNKFRLSVCVPIYRGSDNLERALDSLFKQQINVDYEVVLGDDNPPEMVDEIRKTKEIIASFNKKFIYYKNTKNLGSALNIRKLSQTAKGDIMFFLCQDDVLSKDALQKTYDAFSFDSNIGVITRPYFWFEEDISIPIRAVTPYDENRTSILSLSDNKKAFMKIFESLGQLSGLAYRKSAIDILFGDECFTGHIYSFASILKKYKCVFLKDYTVAVKLADSQARNVSSIYDISPTESWINMFKNIFKEKKYKTYRNWGIEQAATNFVGLIQLKNYAKKGILEKEIIVLIKNRWQNLLDLKFWFYTSISLLLPKHWLIPLSDYYKTHVNSKRLPRISFSE